LIVFQLKLFVDMNKVRLEINASDFLPNLLSQNLLGKIKIYCIIPRLLKQGHY